MTFTAEFDTRALDRQLRRLSRSQQFGANSRALKRAQQSMRKAATKEVQEELNLKSGPIRDVVQARVREVGRRHVKLSDLQTFIIRHWTAVLFACVDHRTDTDIV